jgi:glycosyltransferase involved in cell wall biosynthesis
VRISIEERLRKTGHQPASLRVIFNQCPVENIRSMMLEKDPDIPVEPYILNVARLVPQKGHRRLLEAYAMAAPSELLVIVGDGVLRSSLETLARELGIEDRVRFVGKKQNPYPWMHHARLFVLSSEHEGLPLVLSESLACGTLVVSVDCPGGIRDVLKGELEEFVSEMSALALAGKISHALAKQPFPIKDEWLADFHESQTVAAFLAAPSARVHGAGE